MKNCCIVIPTHKEKLIDDEHIFFINNINKLKNKYDIFLVYPKSLNVNYYINIYPNLILSPFDDKWFSSYKAYNDFCTNYEFYENFINDYTYMLICQTDAIICNSNLDYFIKLDYDFYGALCGEYNCCKNGGLSLRKIQICYDICKKHGIVKKIKQIHDCQNEDVYFTVTYKNELKLPPDNICQIFSLTNPTSEVLDIYVKNKIKIFGLHDPKINYDFNKLSINIALCCIIKDENRYLRDFIKHYKSIGIDKIFLYDNNSENGENPLDVIYDFVLSGFVTIYNVRGLKAMQCPAYIHCYKENNKNFDWMCFFDIDEYLMLYKDNNIKEYLSRDIFNNFDIIHINWKVFNDNGNVYYDNKPFIERFTTPVSNEIIMDNNIKVNDHIKSIIRCNIGIDIINFINPHTVSNGLKCCNSNGELTEENNHLCVPVNHDLCALHHFQFKTIDEYLFKIKRGYADVNLSFNELIKRNNTDLFFIINKRTEEKENFINIWKTLV